MKVTIKPGTEHEGLVFRKEVHTVTVAVTMTAEEQAAAKAANILDEQLFVVPWDTKKGRGVIVTVKDLTKGLFQTGRFPDFIKATEFTNEVKGTLVNVKAALEAKMGSGEEQFEL